MKEAKKLERYFKGVANHRRIDILYLVHRNHNITVVGIAQTLGCNLKTISEHTRRLVQSGLLNKQYRGREVIHSISPYGKRFVAFAQTF